MNESPEVSLNEESESAVKKLYFKVWEHRLVEVWDLFQTAGLNPILIKGWAASQFYPDPSVRTFVDIDLMFDPVEFEAAKALAAKLPVGAVVDVHRGARHLDELTFKQLRDGSLLKQCLDSLIRVPCEEDHLRLLCVHWLNDGGVNRQRLQDIYFAISNRRDDFDWDRCLGSVSRKRRKWVVSAILLVNRFLDLPLDGIPIAVEERALPDWLVRTIEKEWSSGTPLIPLHNVLGQRKEFWVQFQMRFLPNPIQATIEVGGEFNDTPRIFYQLADIVKRAYPSLKRIAATYWTRFRPR